MSLRPRYSLLTLLILTALVAGGVKLWHGPHRVVERTIQGEEVSYTYTRDWRGERTIHGAYIRRNVRGSRLSPAHTTNVEFYRAGQPWRWSYALISDPEKRVTAPGGVEFASGLGLTVEEQLTWKHAIEHEQERLSAQGVVSYGSWWMPWTAKEIEENTQKLRSELPPGAEVYQPPPDGFGEVQKR